MSDTMQTPITLQPAIPTNVPVLDGYTHHDFEAAEGAECTMKIYRLKGKWHITSHAVLVDHHEAMILRRVRFVDGRIVDVTAAD